MRSVIATIRIAAVLRSSRTSKVASSALTFRSRIKAAQASKTAIGVV
jgi:hypothetical protein